MNDTPARMPEIPGFRLRKILGRGGMATVFLAEPVNGGNKVAIKVLRAPEDAAGEWSERFLREAAMLQQLDHPNIIKVHASGESAGDHYMVMEYLDHGDLSTWIRQGLQPVDALRLLRQLALGLAHAHRLGYVHRDMKPDNVLFRADGTPVITDFGIARRRATDPRLTQVGMAIGTPAYMSPEQHKGLEVDARTDIYALGIIFHEMLMKQVPYTGNDSVSIGIRHLQDPLPQLPPSLARFQRFLDSLLAKNPGERISQATSVVQAIDLLLTEPEPTAKRAIAAAQILQRGLDVRETQVKTGMFSKACDIAIDIGADDYDALRARWADAGKVLREWREENGRKARGITLQFFVHPWILGRTRDFVRGLAATDEYRFLAELHARVCIHDLDGVLEHESVLGAENA